MVGILATILIGNSIYSKPLRLPFFPLVGDELTVMNDKGDSGLTFNVVGRHLTGGRKQLELKVSYSPHPINAKKLLEYGWK